MFLWPNIRVAYGQNWSSLCRCVHKRVSNCYSACNNNDLLIYLENLCASAGDLFNWNIKQTFTACVRPDIVSKPVSTLWNLTSLMSSIKDLTCSYILSVVSLKNHQFVNQASNIFCPSNSPCIYSEYHHEHWKQQQLDYYQSTGKAVEGNKWILKLLNGILIK